MSWDSGIFLQHLHRCGDSRLPSSCAHACLCLLTECAYLPTQGYDGSLLVLQALGLEITSATRASFLIQARSKPRISSDEVPCPILYLVPWKLIFISHERKACKFTAHVQLTALLTPALAMAAGEKPAKSVWLGCLFAMAGTILLTLDNAPRVAPPANAANLAIGDALDFCTKHGDLSAHDSGHADAHR